ncbi:43kDa postsynaptic protein [Parasponia andersonii]|uniref:43kDa postsynaptic protein n=1 Tax=Parasponia andersonii TaxID=3476 RepID=A0A2P5DJH2_PARAD|nr:43kDa postsynaptic protein [Parasponia andersonii]
MIVSVFLALFLPCAGMSAVFIVYLCLLWYATIQQNEQAEHQFPSPAKPVPHQGLSASELEKLPKVSVTELVMGNECAVCLDEIEDGQPARLLPGCNHGFHLKCADTWLSKHSVCPICRAKIDSLFFSASEQNPC